MAHQDAYEDEPPRSIFSTLWFRALVVVLVLGVVAAVAVPYVLEMVNPPMPQTAATVLPAPPASPPTPPAAGSGAAPPAAMTAPATPPAAPTPSEPAATRPAEPPAASAAPEISTRLEPSTAPAASPEPAATGARRQVARATPEARTPAAPTRRPSASGGTYWVQVGAFRDQEAARRLAAVLREQNYPVRESVKRGAPAPAAAAEPPASDRYNIFISGATAAEVSARLSARNLSADPVAGGVMVKPSLPLREAVALSRDLTGEGLKVQVRRAGSQPAAAVASSERLYRVRIGGFADRAAAQAVARELEGKGFKPFIARGGS